MQPRIECSLDSEIFFNNWCSCLSDRNCKTKKSSHCSVFRFVKSFWFNWPLALLEKPKHLVFCSSAVLFIKSYLNNRHQRVVTTEAESDWLEVRQGVPQGTFMTTPLQSICKWSTKFHQLQFNPICLRCCCLYFRRKNYWLQALFREINFLSGWLFSIPFFKTEFRKNGVHCRWHFIRSRVY